MTYGAAADRDGNGWWAEMQLDIIGKADPATGKVDRDQAAAGRGRSCKRVSADEKKFYDTFTQPDFNTPLPWSQGPRRMGTDKNADVLWIGNSWGGSLTAHRHQDDARRRSCRCPARCSPTTSRSTASTTPGSTSG